MLKISSIRENGNYLIKRSKKDAFLTIVVAFIFWMIFCAVVAKLELIDIMSGSRRHALETRVESDLRNIGTAIELQYTYDNNDKYIQSSILPESIGPYMEKVHSPPHKDYTYIWIDNTGEGGDQHFCIYTKLKFRSPDTWVVVSEKGVNDDVTREPTGLGDACW